MDRDSLLAAESSKMETDVDNASDTDDNSTTSDSKIKLERCEESENDSWTNGQDSSSLVTSLQARERDTELREHQ
ncbi:unnamed protein product, partial [Candidula unifasciata]